MPAPICLSEQSGFIDNTYVLRRTFMLSWNMDMIFCFFLQSHDQYTLNLPSAVCYFCRYMSIA